MQVGNSIIYYLLKQPVTIFDSSDWLEMIGSARAKIEKRFALLADLISTISVSHMFAKILVLVSFRVFGFCPWYRRRFFRPSFKNGLLSAKAKIMVEFMTMLNTVRNSQSGALPFSLRTTSFSHYFGKY